MYVTFSQQKYEKYVITRHSIHVLYNTILSISVSNIIQFTYLLVLSPTNDVLATIIRVSLIKLRYYHKSESIIAVGLCKPKYSKENSKSCTYYLLEHHELVLLFTNAMVLLCTLKYFTTEMIQIIVWRYITLVSNGSIAQCSL